VLHRGLLDKNANRCEPLADLPYPVILLQGRKSGSDRLIECLRRDLYRVLNVSNILDRNCARSENHTREGNRFAFCSPLLQVCWTAGLPFGESHYGRRRENGLLIATKEFLYSAALSIANTLDTK
jgi:hypothetical protein